MTVPTSCLSIKVSSYEEFLYGKPLIYVPRDLSLFGRLIAWIKEDKTFLLNIATIVLTATACILLCVSLIGIPFVLKGIREANIQDLDQHQKTRYNALFPIILGTRRAVMDAIGGPNRHTQLPVLNIGNSVGTNGYIDFLTPQELSAPLMRGEDRYGRPFIACKLQDRTTRIPFVLTLFQRYLDQPYWVWAGPVNALNCEPVLTGEGLQALRQIVVEDMHPRFMKAEG